MVIVDQFIMLCVVCCVIFHNFGMYASLFYTVWLSGTFINCISNLVFFFSLVIVFFHAINGKVIICNTSYFNICKPCVVLKETVIIILWLNLDLIVFLEFHQYTPNFSFFLVFICVDWSDYFCAADSIWFLFLISTFDNLSIVLLFWLL